MRLANVIADLQVRATHGLDDQTITGIAYDSRVVRPGNLFVALVGERFDSHDLIEDAVAAGATVVVGSNAEKLAAAPAWVQVDNSRRALGLCANAFFGRPGLGLSLIGFTGTNGKTTGTYLLEAALAACGVACGVVGTVDARYGDVVERVGFTTPEAPVMNGLLARMRDAGMGAALTEVSSHGLSLHRVDGLDFALGVFTNLSQDHLDFHKTMEEYGEAKARFFTEVLPESHNLAGAIINFDDPWGATLRSRVSYPCLTYGFGDGADIQARDVRFGIDGVHFVAQGPWGTLEVTSPMVGRHNVYNLLATLAAVHMLQRDVATAAAGLARLGTIPGRLEAVENPFGFGIWVDYCHTPDALEKVLLALREVVPNRLITVFGAGGDRDRKKRPEMGAVVERYSDLAVVTSDNPRTEDPLAIVDDILGGLSHDFRFRKTLVVPDRALAIQTALGLAAKGDGILVGGKGHETYQIIGTTTHDFDDSAVARDAIAAMEALTR